MLISTDNAHAHSLPHQTVAKHVQEMALQGVNAPETLSAISRSLTTAYSQLVDSARGALATIEGEEVQ